MKVSKLKGEHLFVVCMYYCIRYVTESESSKFRLQ